MTRIATMLATALSSVTLGTSAFVDPPKALIWNASASAPIGLYAVRPANDLDITDLVAVAAPPLIAEFMADRGYLPMGAPILKRVLALPGETVWFEDGHIVRDGRGAVDFVPESMLDHCTSGAVQLGNDEYFLLGDNRRVSVDSRVFGALPRDAIIGKVLMRFQAGNAAMESAAAAKP